MKQMYQKRPLLSKNAAFTLIELLVVVLIIGILAAVSVPQYQLSVCKTHMSQVEIINRKIYDASRVYLLANGKVPSTFEELDFTLPGYEHKTEENGRDQLTGGKYSFTLDPGAGVPRVDGQFNGGACKVQLYTYLASAQTSPEPGHCIAYGDIGVKYCLNRWPGSICIPGTGTQTICSIHP